MNNAFFFAIRIVLYRDYDFLFLDKFHHKNSAHRQDLASIMFWGSLYGNLDDEEDGTFIFTVRMILHQWGNDQSIFFYVRIFCAWLQLSLSKIIRVFLICNINIHFSYYNKSNHHEIYTRNYYAPLKYWQLIQQLWFWMAVVYYVYVSTP